MLRTALLLAGLLAQAGAFSVADVPEDQAAFVQAQVQVSTRAQVSLVSLHNSWLQHSASKVFSAFTGAKLLSRYFMARRPVMEKIEKAGQRFEAKVRNITTNLVEAVEPGMPIPAFAGEVVESLDEFKKVYTTYETGLLLSLQPLSELIEKFKANSPSSFGGFAKSVTEKIEWDKLKEVGLESGLEEVRGYFDGVDGLPREEQERRVRKLNAAQEDGMLHGQKAITGMDQYSMLAQTLLIAKETEPTSKQNAETMFRFMAVMTKEGQTGFKALVDGVHKATKKLGIEWGLNEDWVPDAPKQL